MTLTKRFTNKFGNYGLYQDLGAYGKTDVLSEVIDEVKDEIVRALEAVVPEEEEDTTEGTHFWNRCRQEVLNKIERLKKEL